jgi:CBS domain-containing protein
MKHLKAKDVMTRPVVSARKNASARDIALQLLSGLYSGMPVTDENGRVVGIVTEFDLLEQLRQDKELARLTAEDIMVRDAMTIDVNTPIDDAFNIMLDRNIIRLPVTEEDKLVGIIARCDILRVYIEPEFTTYM